MHLLKIMNRDSLPCNVNLLKKERKYSQILKKVLSNLKAQQR